MKTLLWCSLLFLCGLGAGVLLSYQHRLFPAGASAAQTDAFSQWEAAAKAGHESQGHVAPKLRDKLLPLMAASDAPRAWKLLLQPGTNPRKADFETIARHWARQDGHAAATFGLAITDPIERRSFLSVALSCWFGEEPQVFLDWLKAQPGRESLVSHLNYEEYRTRLKPEAASLDFIAAVYRENPTYHGPMAQLALRVWQHAEQREAVLAWLRRQPASDQRDQAWRDLATELAATDPGSAAALAKEITTEKVRQELTSTVAAWMTKADPAAGLAYAQTLPDEISRNHAWTSALGTWLMQDAAAAHAHVQQHASTLTPGLLQPVAHLWVPAVPDDPLKDLQYLKGTEESRAALVKSIMHEWINQVPDAARRWLASPEAASLPAQVLAEYRQLAETPRTFSGGGIRTIKERRVWISY